MITETEQLWPYPMPVIFRRPWSTGIPFSRTELAIIRRISSGTSRTLHPAMSSRVSSTIPGSHDVKRSA